MNSTTTVKEDNVFVSIMHRELCTYLCAPTSRELKDDAPAPGGCCSKKVKVATQLIIYKAVGLEKQDSKGTNTYLLGYSLTIK